MTYATLELTRLKAGLRSQIVAYYVDEGFSREEAMAIMLQEMANFKAAQHSVEVINPSNKD